MTSSLVIWDEKTGKIYPYPRVDSKPVVNLDPGLHILKEVIADEPLYDSSISSLGKLCQPDIDKSEWVCKWVIYPLNTEISPPDAEKVGQEWKDPEGDLWKVVQGRDEEGKFLPDNPDTVQKESLSWREE